MFLEQRKNAFTKKKAVFSFCENAHFKLLQNFPADIPDMSYIQRRNSLTVMFVTHINLDSYATNTYLSSENKVYEFHCLQFLKNLLLAVYILNGKYLWATKELLPPKLEGLLLSKSSVLEAHDFFYTSLHFWWEVHVGDERVKIVP